MYSRNRKLLVSDNIPLQCYNVLNVKLGGSVNDVELLVQLCVQ